MIEERRRLDHQRRLAYEQEFGDSDDVFMGDVDELEKEFANPSTQSILAPPSQIVPRADPTTASFTQDAFGDDDDDDEDEANPEKLYQAYLPDLRRVEEDEDEFEKEFEDIDPQTLANLLDSAR
jgi:hypothetical protein